jgi:hypothetical protein
MSQPQEGLKLNYVSDRPGKVSLATAVRAEREIMRRRKERKERREKEEIVSYASKHYTAHAGTSLLFTLTYLEHIVLFLKWIPL